MVTRTRVDVQSHISNVITISTTLTIFINVTIAMAITITIFININITYNIVSHASRPHLMPSTSHLCRTQLSSPFPCNL